MSGTAEIPVVLTVDVEPDDREADPTAGHDWTGFDPTVERLEDLRSHFAAVTGAPVRYSWFLRMDPQVERVHGSMAWFSDNRRAAIRRLEAQGDVIGLHTHAFRWNDDQDRWVSDHGDQRWIDHCIRSSCAAFERSFGRAPRHFRFGDRYMSNRVMRRLRRLGVRYDLTQEPGKAPTASLNAGELTTGMLPDYRDVPSRPFRPSRIDFRRSARWFGGRLWEIPVTTERLPSSADSKALNLASPSASFQAVMEQALARPAPHLVIVSRTNMTVDPRFRPRFDETVDHLRNHPERHRFRFVTPDELVARTRLRPKAATTSVGASAPP